MAIRLWDAGDKVNTADNAVSPLTAFTISIGFYKRLSASVVTNIGTLVSFGNQMAANQSMCNLSLNYSSSHDPGIHFQHFFSGTTALYETSRDITENEWHVIALSYDNASPSTDPVLYRNGVAETWDLSSIKGIGTPTVAGGGAASADTIALGTNMGQTQDYGTCGGLSGGDLAEIGIWNIALPAARLEALTNRYSPLFFREGLFFYHTLQRDYEESVSGLALTWTSIPVGLPHPRIIYQRGSIFRKGTSLIGPLAMHHRRMIGVS